MYSKIVFVKDFFLKGTVRSATEDGVAKGGKDTLKEIEKYIKMKKSGGKAEPEPEPGAAASGNP